MKKRISTVLAVVLTIALLVSSLVMLSVHAEDPATEMLTIGSNEYEIYIDKKYTAYDSMAAAVNGLTPDSTPEGGNGDLLQGPVVSFADTAWKAEANALWLGNTPATPTYIQSDPAYTQIAFYNQAPAFGHYSVSLYNGGLHVNPSHSWLGSNEIYAINLKFTAKEAGDVVIYDTKGTVSASGGANVEPFWDWLSGNVGEDWITFTIYKNGTKLWPLNGEDNKFEAGGEQIAFPDLGTITVAANDVITVKVEGYSSRAGIDINPAVAYTTSEGSDIGGEVVGGEGSEKITIGTSEYIISTADKFNARDVIADALKNTAFSADTDVELTTAWNVAAQYEDWGHDTKFAYFQKGGKAKLAFENWLADTWVHEIIIEDNGLVVNPAGNGKIGYINLSYTAVKEGEIVIYDVAGSISAIKDADPHWGWWDGGSQAVTVTIYKNDEKIWPTSANEANIITRDNDTLAFPDLGKIAVIGGDVITVKFDTVAGLDPMMTDLEVAYIYEEPSNGNEITVGNSTYTILPDYKYNAFEDLSAVASKYKAEDKSAVSFTGRWSVDAKYTKASEFGKDPWGSEFGFKYQIINSATNTVGFQSAHYMTGNTFTPASVVLDNTTKKVMVSPYILWSENICDVASQRLVFTANRSGKVILYDEFGCFDGNGFAKDPYWANESIYPDRKTYLEIYKNDTKIWPTGSDEAYINGTNLTVEFPDLGEISVKAGDEISIVYTTNTPNHRTGAANSPTVAYTVVTGATQTDANFGTEVMILVSVIAVLGAVVIVAGCVSRKYANNR